MIRRPSSFRSVAAAANTSSAPFMAYRPYFPIGHRRAYYSDDHHARGDQADFVSGDSHFQAIRETNRGFRTNYRSVPPPTQYHVRPVSNEGLWSGPKRPAGPGYGNFRPQQTWPQRFKPKPPDYREWEYAKRRSASHCDRFTVLSYNILADYLATDHYQKLYFHIPRYMMDWGWRKRSLSFELGLWSADILCLQEVDRFQDLVAELKPRGYSGIWKMRSGDRYDGCAVFWRDSRFKLLHEESIEYNKLFLRDNVAQICVFESLNGNNSSTKSPPRSSTTPNRVVVCNIHVLFNPKRGDIKLGQIRLLLDRACAVSKLWDDAPVVICGDFNSTPKSPLYNFITEQKLDLSDVPRDKVSGQASAEIHPPRPAFRDPRMQYADDSTRVSAVDNAKKTEQEDVQSDSAKNQNQSADHSIQVSMIDCERSEQGDSLLTKVASSETHSSHPSGSERPFERYIHTSPDVSIPKGMNDDGSSSHESTSHVVFELDEKLDSLNLNKANGDGFREDSDTFLAELHGTGQLSILDESGSSLHDQNLQSIEDEILDETISERLTDEGKVYSSQSLWTPSEIEAATGNADCRVMEHPLKLRSAYAQVANSSGSRDSNGEPLVTSYHLRFSGTVDYIWHSDGLETSRVLAPIPKHVMHQTQGFPTKKWGSDHIALVSELAFVSENTSNTNIVCDDA